jgi:hypothetical protein
MYVHITEHASSYTRLSFQSRTLLRSAEIVGLIESGSFVRFGENEDARFDLIWDHYKKVPIILLTADGRAAGETVVITVWESNFKLPVNPPNEEQILSARIKSEEFWSRFGP